MVPVFVPATVFGIGQGAAAPLIAITARDLGASVAGAGLVVALLGLGQVLGDLPAGALVRRVGERRSLIGASALALLGAIGCALTPSLLLLGVAVLGVGVANAVWGLARQAYVTETVPVRLRARAMSTLGGTNRIGFFLGPFLGAAAVLVVGASGGYWVQALAVVVAGVVVAALPDAERADASVRTGASTLSVVRRSARLLGTLGIAALLVGAARASRQVAIPLWGEQLGLPTETISLVFGLSGAMDALLFYPAGRAMDRRGRRFVAVPCMLVLGATLLVLPLTGATTALVVVALVMGVGNGLGSGIIMTLGADVAPRQDRASFLGAWRLCHDLGNTAGPLVISGVAALAGLAGGLVAMGGLSWVGALALHRWIPRAGMPGYVPGSRTGRASTS